MSDETVSDRGFIHWEPIVPFAGRGDGTDTVKFYESSAATAVRGIDSVELMIDGPFAWLAVGDRTAHLTRDEVGRLQDYIGRWLDRNPAEDDQGGTP